MGKNLPRYHITYYRKHREEILARAKERHQTPAYKKMRKDWREKNREKLRQQARDYFQKNKNKINLRRKKRRRKQHQEVIERLGRECVRCGYNKDWRALQIDHINGGGTKERQCIGVHEFYRHVLRMSEEEMKSKYQLLCANCNAIKAYEEGATWVD